MSVTFTPTQIEVRTAAVTITYGAAASQQSVALSGTGITSGPNATLSPTSMTFHYFHWHTYCLAPFPQTATLTNFGTETLSITGITIGGTGFSQTHTCGTSLGPLQSCTISVSFHTNSYGTFTGALHVYDNAPGNPQSVALTGVHLCN
jgi:hypothetical protein